MKPAPAGAAVRAGAARVLARIRFDGASLKAALPAERDGLPDPRDRALLEATVFAGCRALYRYEALLRWLLEKPLARRDATVHGLLLAALAQLDALAMPAHAVLAASVDAARLLGRPRHAGLVNAVLRRFQREHDALIARVANDDEARLGHPRWLIDALRAAWPEQAEAVFAAVREPPPLWLRINARRIAGTEYRARLAELGIEAGSHPALPQALCLPHAPAPTTLPGWEQGWVSVQDGAAQLCALALDARPGQRVLDACAAPGGKAAALLEAIDALDLLALDIDPVRVERMRAALARLGLAATARAADAGDPESWWDGRPFDRILLDAPCSATGIARRQPDVLWHRRADDIGALAAIQDRLLQALWPLLAPGGRLVYATCSILPDENARRIDAFLARHPDARALALADVLGRTAGAGRQRLPGEDGMDGFFYAALERAP